MSQIEYVDFAPPEGDWYLCDVMRTRSRGWDWTAWLSDTPDDEMQRCYNEGCKVKSVWLRIPGKHRSRAAAYEALEAFVATRH